MPLATQKSGIGLMVALVLILIAAVVALRYREEMLNQLAKLKSGGESQE